MTDLLVITESVRAVLAEPSPEQAESLRPLLASDVRAAGPVVSASGVDDVVAGLAAPPMPVLGLATWSSPEQDGAEVRYRAELPSGFPISAALISIRFDDEGQVIELLQEVEMAPPPEPVPLRLDGELAESIDNAYEAKHPVIVGYVDGDGAPHLSFRGTVYVHSPDQLAFWVRDPNGGLLRAIETNPELALFFHDPESQVHYDLSGRARRVDDPDEANTIFERGPAFERNLDPARRGAAVVVDVERVTGGARNPLVMLRSKEA